MEINGLLQQLIVSTPEVHRYLGINQTLPFVSGLEVLTMRIENMNESYHWTVNILYSILIGKVVTMTYHVRKFATRLLTDIAAHVAYVNHRLFLV